MLTQKLVVLAVLGAVVLVCAPQVFSISRGGSASSTVHDHARTEVAARRGASGPRPQVAG